MKFSFTLIKKLVPEIKSKTQLVEALNLYSFESEDAGGDVFEVSVPPNRYSDAASHIGIAREASAILSLNLKLKSYEVPLRKIKGEFPKVEVKDIKLCRRYAAQRFENIKVKPSPAWMQEILKDCGLRPINNIVDTMNYAMLETGQPLHAFDADKIKGAIRVRRAEKGEPIITLDGVAYKLNSDILLISDEEGPLAIAGIKGGQRAEVDAKTRRIIVEAANFDAVNIYKSSKFLNLTSDASLRFSHGLSPVLVELGLGRASELLQEDGAEADGVYDSHPEKPGKRIIEFDIQKFNQFIGASLNSTEAFDYLKRLGFSLKGDLIEVPPLRQDIENFEDLAEEVARLAGYDKLKAIPPHVSLQAAVQDDIVILKEQLRKILISLGLSEVYNYSFVSEKDSAPELTNPISKEFQFLRPNLAGGLLKNIEANLRFYDEVKIFEIGKVFEGDLESWRLGMALVSKKKETIFELKGFISELFEKIGLVDFFMRDADGILRIESNHSALGYLRKEPHKANISLAEIDLDKLLELVEGELEFRPLPKYPAVMRDISILVSRAVRIGEILEVLNLPDFRHIADVDLIDEYESEDLGEDRQSLTFRIVFRSDERTLTDAEVDQEMTKITEVLRDKFKAEIR